MKTKEHLNQKYAHGPVNLYDIYLEGYQDCKKDNEDSFRREAAKDILAGMMAHQRITYGSNYATLAKYAIAYADELIRQIKQE